MTTGNKETKLGQNMGRNYINHNFAIDKFEPLKIKPDFLSKVISNLKIITIDEKITVDQNNKLTLKKN